MAEFVECDMKYAWDVREFKMHGKLAWHAGSGVACIKL